LNFVDIIILIALAVGTIRGLRRGLIRSLLGLLGLVLGLVLASQFYRPLCQYLESRYSWVSSLAGSIAPHLPLATPVAFTPATDGSSLTNAIHNLSLPEFVTSYLTSSASAGVPPGSTVGEALAYVLASGLVGVACFLFIFACVQLVALVLGELMARVVAVTPLVILDRLAGLAMGLGWSAVILSLLVGGVGLLGTVPAFSFLQDALEGSKLAPALLSLFEFLLPRAPGWLGQA
jgi:membrane protein required for colicin V production